MMGGLSSHCVVYACVCHHCCLCVLGGPPVVLCNSLENLTFWHSRMLLCLASLTLLINALHSLKVMLSKTLANCSLHVSLCRLLKSIVLLMVLTHSFNNCFFHFTNNFIAFGGITVFLSFTLTAGTHKYSYTICIQHTCIHTSDCTYLFGSTIMQYALNKICSKKQTVVLSSFYASNLTGNV